MIMRFLFSKPFIVASVRAAMVLIVVDLILEIFAKKLFGMHLHVDTAPVGIRFHLMGILLPLLEMFVVMSVYVAILPRFTNRIYAALATSCIFLLFSFIFSGHFVSIGLISIRMYITFIFFSIIEFPLAVFAFSSCSYGLLPFRRGG